MKQKLISAMLAITILSSYIPVLPLTTVSEAAVTTSWEYNYTGAAQSFKAPYKGIYKIEAYGAQGGVINENVTGGKGSYTVGNIELAKNSAISVNIGGQNGYNGGGSGNSTQAVGGGATDIRYGGTATSNRILVAAGGGGSYSTPNYHSHTASCNTKCSGPSRGWYWDYGVNMSKFKCDTCGGTGYVSGDDDDGGMVWYCVANSTITGCGKTPGVTIDSYTHINGSGTASSNNTEYQGSTGGGGGYYGGNAQYAGTSYTSAELVSSTSVTEDVQEGNGKVKITLIESYPEVSLSASKTNTNQNVTITAAAKDDVIGLTSAPYSWNGEARVVNKTYAATKNGTYTVDVINNYGNTENARIEVKNIDKIKPVVTKIEQSVGSDNRTSILTLTATDSASSDYIATGVTGYAITTSKTAPTEFQSSNTFTVNKNGTYYGWAKDAVGNISELSTSTNANILVKALEIDVKGAISWNDQSNKYASRGASKVHLYRKVGENGEESLVESKNITAGQTSYSFVTRECDDSGKRYIFRIAQDYVPGYETIYTGNSVTSNSTQTVNIAITNNLILPTYTSNIQYNLIDGFRGEYLKNTKVETIATIQASSANRDKTGLNQSKITYLIDDGLKIDKNNIVVTYTDGTTGKNTIIDDYILQKNNITVNYGIGTNYVTKAGDKLTIKIQGVFSGIKAYKNSITLTGNLTDYKGTNTSINLGEVTKAEKNYEVKYQKPKANIKITKKDSITEGLLTDATFTLYEWDGSKYVQKEILKDDNKDGIYESAYYEWTGTTGGKYKVLEAGIPVNHKDLEFSMEYVIDQLKTDNYTITPDYTNGAYRIAYGVRNPDDFDKVNGVVENEPFKLKVSIDNRDSQTKNQIVSNATYTIYEWDKANNKYIEYVSKTSGNKVTMTRGTNKIYVSNGWLYYTPNNEGKYKVVETTVASGYYGDYTNGAKKEYIFNIVDIVNSGTYEGQKVANEGTIKIKNNTTSNTLESKRVDTKLNIILIDSGTKQGSSIVGAKYGIYAKEIIKHADGVTTNYQREAGVLYKKDELVKEVTTNAGGKIVVEDLECGKYYIKQLTAPNGYVLDTQAYDINLSYAGQEKALIEASKTIESTLITHNITGTVTWNDENNKYVARPENVQVTLLRTPTTGVVTGLPGAITVAGNASYNFNNVQTYDTTTGKAYTYTVNQNKVSGYKTSINGFNITNDLIIPTYTSSITYTPKDTYNNKYLKNGKVKINAVVQNTNDETYKELGLNNGVITFTIDSAVTLDTNTLKIYYTNTKGTKKEVTSYTVNGNVITIDFGDSKISKVKDKVEIEIIGTASQIKEYASNIKLTGNLRAYDGENTSINLGTLTSKEAKFKVEYQMPKAKIKITKRDSITEGALADATFTLYEWDGSKYAQKEILTDSNKDGIYESAYYEWNTVTEGKYKVAETGVPVNHKDLNFSMEFAIDQLKAANYDITPDYSNGNYTIAYSVRNPDDFDNVNGIVENEPFKLKVSIENKDAQTKQTIQSNATYTIYEWNKANNKYVEYVSKVNGQKVTMTRGTNKIYLSSQWLYYTANNEGKFKVVETTAAYGYYGDYVNGAKREYAFNILDIVNSGKYEEQTVANEGTIILKNNDTNTIENKRVDTKLNISLLDDETKTNQIQASGSFEGVKYGIYAKEIIKHADGVTTNYQGEAGVLYKKDELIKEVTTNAEGKITVEDLECGKYYIKQLTEPVGYIKDSKSHEVDFTYQGQEKALIEINETYAYSVKKQSIQVLKQQTTSSNEVISLEHAGFTIYEIKELSIVKNGKVSKNADGTYTVNDASAKGDSRLTKKANDNGSYNIEDLVDYYYKIHYTEENMKVLPQTQYAYKPYKLEGEKLVINYANSEQGNAIGEMITGADGYLKTPELAYGEYVLIETSVPHNKETARPTLIKITQDSRTSQSLRYILDPNFEARVKIYTKDMETGKVILKENAAFTITNKETGKLVTYKGWNLLEGNIEYGTEERPYETTRKGFIVTPMELAVGNYELTQIKAAEGYVVNGHEGYSENGEIKNNPSPKVSFEIGTNQMYYVDTLLEDNIIVTVQENKAQVGTLKVTVEGEKLQSVDKTKTPYTFGYVKQKLQGVKIGLYAKEDIYTQDDQGTKLYNKDQLVQTKTTDENGVINYDNIPIGNYYIKEISTIEGFALNKETKDISITYGTNEINMVAQETPVTKHETQTEDIRQKVSITITNKDSETNEAIQGTTIGIYAKENIVNKDGQVVVNKDELIETGITNAEGKIKITQDLPLGMYYVKQTKTATGYIENKDVVEIDARYMQDAREVIEIQKEMKNLKTSIYVKPVDESGNAISGSKLQLVDESGNIVEEWTSTNEVKKLTKLVVGKKYTVKQKEPIPGYATISETEIVMKADGNLQTQVSDEQNMVKPVHYTTKLQINLQDKETGEEIEAVRFQIMQEGNIVHEFTTTASGYYMEKLPIGKYILHQVEQTGNIQNNGYTGLKDVEFEIKDTKKLQTVKLQQDYTKVEVEVVDKETGSKVEGVKFEIYHKKAGGSEEKVREFTTGVENYSTTRLAVGEYILREVAQQKESVQDKGYATLGDISFTILDTAEIQKVTAHQDHTKLEVEIVDKQTGAKVEGAVFEIYYKKVDGSEEKVREFTTGVQNYNTTRLAVGEYILKEQKESVQNRGYASLADISFSIEDKAEMQKVTAVHDYTKLEVEVIDKETGRKVERAKFEIYYKKADGKLEKVREFTSGAENYYTTRLAVGGYILRQVASQKESIQDKGYATLGDIEFTILDKAELQKITAHQDHTKLEVEVIDKETGSKVEAIAFEIYYKKADGSEEKVREFVTTAENYTVTRLAVGEYILRQVASQKESVQDKGYTAQKDILFRVEDTAEMQKVTAVQDYTKLEVEVVDKETNGKIEGAKFEIYKKADGREEKVREFTTGSENYITTRLAVGEYILREVAQQKESVQDKGYATLGDIVFTVEDTAEMQKVTALQDHTKLEVEVVDKETGEKIEGAKFEIYYKKADGVEEKVREFTSGAENYNTIRLAVGEYILRQVAAQKESIQGKGYATLGDISFTIVDTAEMKKVTAKQDHTKLEVEVVDKETGVKIEGAKFEIYYKKADGVEEKVREFTTGAENYTTTRLAVGEYVLRQVTAQKESIQDKGYATLEDISFTVEDKAEVQKVTALQDHTKLEVEVIDKETGEKIEGAKFEIYYKKADGVEEKVREFTTGAENYETTRLAVGEYILRQVASQKESVQDKGYATLGDISFTILDTAEIQKVTAHQDYTKLEIELVDKDTKEKLQGVQFELYNQNQEKILEFTTSEENYIIERLPVGEYTLKQVVGQKESLYDKGYVTNKEMAIKVEDTSKVQKITIEQKESRLEIELTDKEKVPGTTIQIIDKETQKIVAEFTTDAEENFVIEQLPLGDYEIHYKDVDYTQGYIKGEDITITITDETKIQKLPLKQEYTKLHVKLLDKETLEGVIGGTLVIVDKEGKEVTNSWVTNGKPQYIEKLPVGEYYLVQKAAPTLKGYVKTEKVAFKIEETKEVQEVIMLQEFTVVEIELKDEETKENIYDVELQIKDKNENIIANITLKEDAENIIERLPVGEYIIESTKMPYGYKNIQTTIKVTDKGGIQGDLGIKLEREEFDLKVEAWVGEITRNGKTEYENKKLEQKVKKVDIKDSKIKTEDIQISYKIKVSNSAKITGQVGKVEASIPSGMEFIAKDNKTYWKEENGKVVTEGLKGRDIKEGEMAEIELNLRWKNGLESFGTKALEVSIQETQSDIGFKETNQENNKAKTAEVIIGVSTGQMNLVYTCWGLLILLIAVEIIVSRKTKIKKFGIKDKTIKYKK